MPPLVLIATGAGVPYVLDFHEYLVATNIRLEKPVNVYFSCRSIGLFQYVTNMTCKKPRHNFIVNAHLTSHDNIELNLFLSLSLTLQKNETPNSYQPSKDKQKGRAGAVGRLSFAQILENALDGTHVYFCGSPNLQERVSSLCDLYGLTFHLGHAFST